MKVLHVLNTGKYSGAENVAITLIHALEGEVECAYTSPDGPISEILEGEKIQFFPMKSATINAKELKRVIQLYRPDVIHTHDFNAGIMAWLTGTSRPIVNHLHNNTPWLKKLCPKSIAYFISCGKYKKILTVSDSVMDEFLFGNFMKKKSAVVGNPIDLSKIREKAEEKDVLEEPSDIIFLGRLSAQKNPVFFLDVVADLVRKKPDLRVAMVGAGELRETVESEIEKRDLGSNVKLYGFQKNPYGLLKAATVVCMPSAWEGFGLAAIEGLALGKPVVAAPVGGLKGIVNDQCGRLCESKEEYIQEIEKLISDASYYNAKSEGAVKRAEQYDNLISYSQQIRKAYFAVTGKIQVE